MVLVMWCVFAVMVYKVLMLERDYTEYDPYEILELDPVSYTAGSHDISEEVCQQSRMTSCATDCIELQLV